MKRLDIYIYIIVIVIAVLYLIGLGARSNDVDTEAFVEDDIEIECVDTTIKKIGGQIFTCIDGFWTYTGLDNQDNKG